MSDLAYIDDGFTESGYFQASKGLYPEIRFTFRPCTTTERNDYFRRNGNVSAAEQVRNGCKLLKSKLVDWSVKDRKGETLALDMPNLLKLQPSLYDRFIFVVIGQEAGDPDPLKPAAELEEDTADSFRSP